MAVVTTRTDDIDGSPATDEPTMFSFQGVTYSIDLSKENIAKLEKALAPYIENATELRRSAAATAAPAGELQIMREWARTNGFPNVKDKGRLPVAAVDAYNKAHTN